MKVNCDPGSPHFWRRHLSGSVAIEIDGRGVKEVTEADDALGYAEIMIDTAGRPRVCSCGERLISRLMFGQVEIIGKRVNA
jgi:hypothetical protein